MDLVTIRVPAKDSYKGRQFARCHSKLSLLGLRPPYMVLVMDPTGHVPLASVML
jgi:hypothetical protein